jgi:hypothetical protein
VCLALAGTQEELSLVSAQLLANLERDQRVTILWLSKLQALWEQGGYPMVGFTDRMTPDLQFDHVIFVNTGADTATLQIRIEPDSNPRLFVLGTRIEHSTGRLPSRPPTPGRRSEARVSPISLP